MNTGYKQWPILRLGSFRRPLNHDQWETAGSVLCYIQTWPYIHTPDLAPFPFRRPPPPPPSSSYLNLNK